MGDEIKHDETRPSNGYNDCIQLTKMNGPGNLNTGCKND